VEFEGAMDELDIQAQEPTELDICPCSTVAYTALGNCTYCNTEIGGEMSEFSRKTAGGYQLVEIINETGTFRNWFELLDDCT